MRQLGELDQALMIRLRGLAQKNGRSLDAEAEEAIFRHLNASETPEWARPEPVSYEKSLMMRCANCGAHAAATSEVRWPCRISMAHDWRTI